MVYARITISQAADAAHALEELGGHQEVADALFALSNDTDVILTSDGPEDGNILRYLMYYPYGPQRR